MVCAPELVMVCAEDLARIFENTTSSLTVKEPFTVNVSPKKTDWFDIVPFIFIAEVATILSTVDNAEILVQDVAPEPSV